jgi:hypothetical protein
VVEATAVTVEVDRVAPAGVDRVIIGTETTAIITIATTIEIAIDVEEDLEECWVA